jgi:hypothetical protein
MEIVQTAEFSHLSVPEGIGCRVVGLTGRVYRAQMSQQMLIWQVLKVAKVAQNRRAGRAEPVQGLGQLSLHQK